ncbi:hypothetical protein BT93_K2006 [Corymbia citriodora subsp. variegata]|nr:hypothetical protein BT93_K2006 [Corymbia citriodora subsp. variegata]
MKSATVFLITTAILLLSSPEAKAQTTKSPPSSLVPAPAPSPDLVNLTHLLTVAGSYHTFLGYLQSTKVIDSFQAQANNSKDGITIFAPTDQAFSSLKQPSLSNLTQDQLKSLCLFHALLRYYSLSDFKNLSQSNPVSTYAGGQYTLNFTDLSGDVHVNSGWTNTKISSSVLSTNPVAVYQVDRVLLPEAIFGTDIPPMPAPAPSPVAEATPAADTPSEMNGNATSPSSSSEQNQNSSPHIISLGIRSQLFVAVLSVMIIMSG